jgi:hypothetical protein
MAALKAFDRRGSLAAARSDSSGHVLRDVARDLGRGAVLRGLVGGGDVGV